MTQLSISPPTMALASPSQPGMLPDPDSCWAAVQRRDRAFNGRFWFSVQSTGVYCLPSCAARPPLRKNVAFHASPEAAEAAGFRPCKRCRPRDWQAELGLSRPVARACALFDAADADQPPSLAEVARKVGVTANTLSKRFVAELGLTPRDWLIAKKRERFRKALRNGEKVTEALYGAGYGSPSRVYEIERQGARHDARHLRQGRRRRAYRLHHGRLRLRSRAGRGDPEGHRRGLPRRQRSHPRARAASTTSPPPTSSATTRRWRRGSRACWPGSTAASRPRSTRPTCRSTSSAPPSSGRCGRR